MIIFYDKETGKIQGTIEGRVHPESHLKMWIGNQKKTDRIIVQWKIVSNDVFGPDCSQKDIFTQLDKKPSEIHNYKVDLQTKELVTIF